MLDTTAMHFDQGHALNGFAWVTGIWEVSVAHHEDLTWWLQAVRSRWPDTQCLTEGAFASPGVATRQQLKTELPFRCERHRRPRLRARASNPMVMNREFRLALLH